MQSPQRSEHLRTAASPRHSILEALGKWSDTSTPFPPHKANLNLAENPPKGGKA